MSYLIKQDKTHNYVTVVIFQQGRIKSFESKKIWSKYHQRVKTSPS